MHRDLSFLKKIQIFMERHIIPVTERMARQPHLASIRDGMMILIPLTIIGGFSMLVAYPPVPVNLQPGNLISDFLLLWQNWANTYAGILLMPYHLTIGCISIYTAAGISYYLAGHYKLNTVYNTVSAIFIFLMLSHAMDFEHQILDSTNLGVQGMFASIFIAILCVEINRFIHQKKDLFHVSKTVPTHVMIPFLTVIPLVIEVILFSVADLLIVRYTGFDLISVIYVFVGPVLKISNTLPSILLLMVLSSTFWFFGIHGESWISPIISPIITANLAANMSAYQAGEPLPYTMAGNLGVYGAWITYQAFVAAMLLFCKSQKLRMLPKVTGIPSLFNINEPNVFGIPTVLNIFTFIPNIICLVINLTSYYILASAGWIGKPFVSMPFTVPVVIQAFLASADIRNAILVIVLFLVDLVICTPFIKAYDLQLIEEEKEN